MQKPPRKPLRARAKRRGGGSTGCLLRLRPSRRRLAPLLALLCYVFVGAIVPQGHMAAARKLSMRSPPSPRRRTGIDTTITITPAAMNSTPPRRTAPRSTSPRQTRVAPAPARAPPQRTPLSSIRRSTAMTLPPGRCPGPRRPGVSGGAPRRVRRPSDGLALTAPVLFFQRRSVAALTLLRIPRPGALRLRADIALCAS